MFSRQLQQDQAQLWLRMRVELCRLGVRPGLFVRYWNFMLQAEKVKRQTLGPKGSVCEGHLVPLEVREHAWRALVEKYVKDGLDREVLVSLL